MPISQRTATSGTAASGAAFNITLPASTAVGDLVIVGVTNAGTTGPAAPTGWTRPYSASAGSGQSVSVFYAPYSAGLTLSFTNANSVAAWTCNAFLQSGYTILLDGNPVAATNTTNNTTLPTGAPTTGPVAGDYEVMVYGWTSGATISTTATGSTIDRTQANGTSCSNALAHNNTTSLGASTTVTAFSHTLSASNSRKSGVGILLKAVKLVGAAAAAGSATVSGTLGAIRNLAGTADGAASNSGSISALRGLQGTASGAASASGTIDKIAGPTVLFFDDFNRADGALGGNWTGNASIVSNKARLNGFSTQYEINSTSLGTADYTVQAEISQGNLASGGAIGLGLVARYQDVNNFYLAWIDQGATAYVLYRVQSGGYTEIGRHTFGSPNADPVTVALSGEGSTISVSVNGTERISVTDATHTAEGDFGMRAFNPDDGNLTNHRFDNVTVLAVGAVGPSYKDLTGSATGGATVSALIARLRALGASSTGAATASGLLSGRRALSASSSGAATVSGLLSGRRALSASSTGAATVSGLLSGLRALSASSSGSATVSTQLGRKRALSGSSSGAATTSGTLTLKGTLSGRADGGAITNGQLSRRRAMAAAAAGSATTTAQLLVIRGLTGSATGAASASGLLSRQPVPGPQLPTTAALGSPLSMPGRLLLGAPAPIPPPGALLGSATGRTTAAGQLSARRALVGVAHGVATAQGVLTVWAGGQPESGITRVQVGASYSREHVRGSSYQRVGLRTTISRLSPREVLEP